jgi:hypothetical protein
MKLLVGSAWALKLRLVRDVPRLLLDRAFIRRFISAASDNDEKQTDHELATPDNPRNDGLMLKCSRCRVRSVRWFCAPDDHSQANQQKAQGCECDAVKSSKLHEPFFDLRGPTDRRALCLTVRKNYFRGGTSLFSSTPLFSGPVSGTDRLRSK